MQATLPAIFLRPFTTKADVHRVARELNRVANRARYAEAAKAITVRLTRCA